MRNSQDKVPDKAHDEALVHLHRIYHICSLEEARKLTPEFAARHRSLYPRAVDCLVETGSQLLMYFHFPKEHWQSIKTTKPIESIFSPVKLQTMAARRLYKGLKRLSGLPTPEDKRATTEKDKWPEACGQDH
jgi:transposase-like protein